MAKRPTARSKPTNPEAPAQPKPKPLRATTAAAEQTPVGPTVAPTDDEIRRRAYERYQQRGGTHGQHFDDWLEAEKELRGKK